MENPGFRRFALLVLFGLPVLALAAIVALDLAARSWSAAVDRAWAENVGTLDELIARFPERQANPEALHLEESAAALGIDLVPGGEDRSRPDRDSVRLLRQQKPRLQGYLESQIERSHRQIDPPPAELSGFLERHAGELATIRRQFLDGEIPRWERRLSRLDIAPVPNLLGHIDLQKLLLVDALVHAERGAHDLAVAAMEVSWRLNASLRDDPLLITQLVAMEVARLQAGTLRQLPQLPSAWIDRLDERDFRDAIWTGFRLEGHSHYQIAGYMIDDDSWLTVVPKAIAAPYTRLCTAQLGAEWRSHLVNLRRLDYLCDRDLSRLGASFDLAVPPWNLLGKVIVSDLSDVLHRLARLELDLELTRHVLMLRSVPAGAAPAQQVIRSAACPGDRWDYELAADGGFEIRFPREIDWSAPKKRIQLPLRFVEPAP